MAARALIGILVVVMALGTAPAGASEGPGLTLPVFLNGNATYLRTGCAGLATLAADAARNASGADVAILPASCFGGSLPVGEVTRTQLDTAIPPGQQLVVTQCTSDELVRLLNETMLYGSDSFPHLSGVEVRAGRVLSDSGQYRAQVHSIRQGQNLLASRTDENGDEPVYELSPDMISVVTTRALPGADEWLADSSEAVGTTLQDAFVSYAGRMPDESIRYYAEARSLIVIADTIDTDLAVDELAVRIPAPVDTDTWTPGLLADTVLFFLRGQDRELNAHIWGGEIPYTLSICGLDVPAPRSVDLDVEISRTVPRARKTANTFDEDTLFVDLSRNDTIPEGTALTLDVGDMYASETLLHVYHYEENGDIVPEESACIVNASGQISFPVRPSTTYVVNSQELDHSTLFGSPTRSNPFTLGIVVVLGLYALWVILFVRRKRRQKREKARNKAQS